MLIPCLKSCGVSRIDTVFISHFDADHINGIPDLLQDPLYSGRINRIVISKIAPVIDKEAEAYTEIVSLARRNHIPIYMMSAGDRLHNRNLDMVCLSPADHADNYSNANEASLVLYINSNKYNYRGILTGDLGKEGEIEMLNRWNEMSEEEMKSGIKGIQYCNYLKVGHHGSKNSTSDEFIRYYMNDRDSLAIISAGVNNRYGHPHKETLRTLNDHNILIHRTDSDGEIIACYKGKVVDITSFF